jgi:hypothetical protein
MYLEQVSCTKWCSYYTDSVKLCYVDESQRSISLEIKHLWPTNLHIGTKSICQIIIHISVNHKPLDAY